MLHGQDSSISYPLVRLTANGIYTSQLAFHVMPTFVVILPLIMINTVGISAQPNLNGSLCMV